VKAQRDGTVWRACPVKRDNQVQAKGLLIMWQRSGPKNKMHPRSEFMALLIGIPKETVPGEKRVATVPDLAPGFRTP
jgi:hypothetical protein